MAQDRLNRRTYPDVFVNRDRYIDLFKTAITKMSETVGSNILAFYGVGGQGKSALRRHLSTLAQSLDSHNYGGIKPVVVNLRTIDKSDPINLLIEIRRQFLNVDIKLEAFDLALATVWENSPRAVHVMPKLDKSNWAGDFAESVSTFLSGEVVEEAVDAIPMGRLGKWGYNKFNQRLIYDRHPYLSELKGVVKPEEWDLVWILAQNLNWLYKREPYLRYLLFLDEYECVFDEGRTSSKWSGNDVDETVRTLISETDRMLTVFFCREELPWKDSSDWKDDLEGNQKELMGLQTEDARQWLIQEGITDASLQEAMLNSAYGEGTTNKEIYPLLLELNVIYWRECIFR